jgi:hypothetical protein
MVKYGWRKYLAIDAPQRLHRNLHLMDNLLKWTSRSLIDLFIPRSDHRTVGYILPVHPLQGNPFRSWGFALVPAIAALDFKLEADANVASRVN